MGTGEWKVPRPTGVITSRDLARNTSNLQTLSDGAEWVPEAIATTSGIAQPMSLLGHLEIRQLIVRRVGFYLIGKEGMEVLRVLRTARNREADSASEGPTQS